MTDKMDLVEKHLALIFHRFLAGGDADHIIKLTTNGETVHGFDPLCEKLTEVLDEGGKQLLKDFIKKNECLALILNEFRNNLNIKSLKTTTPQEFLWGEKFCPSYIQSKKHAPIIFERYSNYS